MDEKLAKTYEKLRSVRDRKDLSLPPSKYLKTTYLDLLGQEKTLSLRYYQIQMIVHLLSMRRFVIGDDTGLGKTLEAIGSLSLLWEKTPDIPTLIITTKSSAPEWAKEFRKFTQGVQVFHYEGTPTQRTNIWKEFQVAPNPKVLVTNYRKVVVDFSRFQDLKNFVLVTDEATAYKSITSQVHQAVAHLANNSERLWAATATLIKNNLQEGYAIFRIVVPGLFDNRVTKWQTEYCITEQVPGPRNQRFTRVVGYHPEKIALFKEMIDPYYLGRPKHSVAEELPVLIQKTMEIPISKAQDDKYMEALAGTLVVRDEEKAVSKLTSLIYLQQIVNHPALLGGEGSSEKLETLKDLLSEGDLAGEKVIIYSRFKSMVDLLVPALEEALPGPGPKVVRVTGDENTKQREEAKRLFQDVSSPTKVICITAAGGEAINLQAAKAVIFFDTPWSAGEFLQIVGRMIRIGSLHDKCYVIHLVSRRNSSKRSWRTIDHQVMAVLGKKMSLVESILGKRLKGEEDDSLILDENEISDLYRKIQEDARESTQPIKESILGDEEDLDSLFD